MKKSFFFTCIFFISTFPFLSSCGGNGNRQNYEEIDSVAVKEVTPSPEEIAAKAKADSIRAAQIAEANKKRWSITEDIDEMTDSKNVWKSLVSDNEAYFDFPYDGGSKLRIEARYMKKYGTDVIITITKGQMQCSEYNGTNKVTVRFDDDKPITFYTNEPADNSSDHVFLRNARKFINRAKTAKTIKIQVPIYQEGLPTFTFTVDEPLTWEY